MGRSNADISSATGSGAPLSVVVPIYNEAESLPLLFEKLLPVLDELHRDYEVIAVNDGSSDQSQKMLEEVAADHERVKVIEFRRNAGQTAAMMAGFDHASGEIIITLDADLQNDPEDIPMLLEKLEEGYDVVSGWRKDRKDAALRRNLVSRIANRIISRVSGVDLHDYGCTLKAYRRDCLENTRLYGEMHRFVPIYASWQGARVAELPVRHHPRKFGASKYGLERTIKVVLDLMVVQFLHRYLVKPIYVFGGIGFAFVGSAFFFAGLMIYLKFFEETPMINTPLPVLSSMLFIAGVTSVLMGILAEIMSRTYFESQKRLPYSVRQRINF